MALLFFAIRYWPFAIGLSLLAFRCSLFAVVISYLSPLTPHLLNTRRGAALKGTAPLK